MYLYYPHIAKKAKKSKNTKREQNAHYITSIKDLSPLLERNISISTRLVTIPFFSNHFLPILKHRILFLSQMGEHIPDFIRLQDQGCFYSIVTQDTSDYLSFSKEMNTQPSLASILYSFRYLLNSIQILIDNHMIHGNLSQESILFTSNHNPLIQEFTYSIDFGKTNEERKSIVDPTYLPIEAVAIHFIQRKKLASLSSENIESIVEAWSLSSFPEYIIGQFKESAIISLEFYKNKSMDIILSGLFSSWYTWDCYSLSLLYYRTLYPLFKKENSFIIGFYNILIQNSHPESTKRNSISETLTKIEELISITDADVYLDLMTTSLS